MEILETDQVMVSKRLCYMKELGLVTAKREAQWMVYSLADEKNPLLLENLKCLRDCASGELSFKTDLRHRDKILKNIKSAQKACPREVIN